MISSLNSMTPAFSAHSTRPQPAGKAAERPASEPDKVTLQSGQEKPKSWLKGKLATLGLTLGLTAAAMGLLASPALAHDSWGQPHHHHQRPAATCQVQTGSQFGIGVDQNGNLGVYLGSSSYNRCNGTYEQGGVSIGPNGVGVQYGVTGPGGYGFGPGNLPGGQQVIINNGGQVIINQGGYGW